MRTPPSSFVRPVILLLAFTLLLGRPAAAAAEPSSPHAASYIVFEINGSRVTPVSQRVVILDVPLESTSAAAVADALAQPSRAITPIVVTLQASNGAEVYRTVVETSPWLRAEFHGAGEGAPIDGQILPSPQTVFVARVPAIPDSTLTLRGADLRTLGRWDMTRLAAETPRIELPAHAAVAASGDGPPANRVDLLLMGDGYTAGEADKFRADVTKFAEDFASVVPLSTYANYMNVTSLFTPSAESGADHPPYRAGCPAGDPTCCGDPAMQYDALQGRMVSTAFDARYCVSNIHRLLVGNGSKIVAAAAAVPDWDLIAVIVNDPTYGGAGGGIIYASMHPSTTQIAQHEFGHSFARLADEYESPYPGYPSCSDINGPACESNVTDITAREKVKWAPWILPATPIVTPETNDYAGVVGLFEGARYREKGIYRPGLSCIMRSLGAPFCQVPSQSHVLRLYSGGWGQPPGGISLIEPGSTAPKTPARGRSINVNLQRHGIAAGRRATGRTGLVRGRCPDRGRGSRRADVLADTRRRARHHAACHRSDAAGAS